MAWYSWAGGDTSTHHRYHQHHHSPKHQHHHQYHTHHRYRACGSFSDERMHYFENININTDCYHNHCLHHNNHFWHPRRPPLKGTLVLLPPSWDTLTQCWKELTALGFSLSSRKRLILYFVFRGTSFRVCLGDGKLFPFSFLSFNTDRRSCGCLNSTMFFSLFHLTKPFCLYYSPWFATLTLS